MNTIPLSTLPAPVRDRLVDIAIGWLGFDPWTAHEDENGDVLALARDPWFVRLPDSAAYGNALPIHIGAGFDLGVRLYAECKYVSIADVHSDLRADPMRIGVETPADRQPEARLRVMLLGLGRE